jgi:hypothetical protein
MTKLHIFNADVYTKLTPAEVRQYLAGGSKGGVIPGFQDLAGTIPILIAVHAIEYIYV